MNFSDSFKKDLKSIDSKNFESASLDLFSYQWHENKIYNFYCSQLSKNPTNVRKLEDIPFLPISFFKTHKIISGTWSAEKIFLSSGTTKSSRSKHFVKDLTFYNSVSTSIFQSMYGPLNDVSVRALLPSYQQQGDSSLVAMIDHFMTLSHESSKYYLKSEDELVRDLSTSNIKSILIGVSFALLDLAENHPINLNDHIIMETGGMKGRRKEMIRSELHEDLQSSFGSQQIHSEYGMTELLSQAYSMERGYFQFPKWARVKIRDINDPFTEKAPGSTGGINIIDLANVDSCAFIETQDLGVGLPNGKFEVLGRFDNSDIRGCNLLI